MTGSLSACPPPPISALRDDMPPPTSYSSAKVMRPPSMSDAFAVVPPMSRVITLSKPEARREVLGADDPGGRSALDDTSRILRDRVRVEDAAARLHHHQPAADAGPLDLGDHGTHVVLDRRSDVGVDDGGGGALVLELLGQDVHRERDEGTGKHLMEDLAGALLVGGVGIRVQIADRDRFDARGPDPLRRGAHVRFVEGTQHLAARSGALVDLESMLPRHQRRRPLVQRLVEVRHPHPPELQHVAEPAGGEQCGGRALAFEDRVGRDRAAVQQLFEGIERGSELFEQAADPGDDRIRVVVGRRGKLARGELPIGREYGNVGEGAADIGSGACRDRRAGHVQRYTPFD